jgi:predicted nucleotidyltransferase
MEASDLQRTVAPICDRFHVRTLDLFGSRATQTARDESDFDFCALFDELPPSEYARCFFGVLHGLEDALGRPVDLLTWQAIRKPGLRSDIQKHGLRLYG